MLPDSHRAEAVSENMRADSTPVAVIVSAKLVRKLSVCEDILRYQPTVASSQNTPRTERLAGRACGRKCEEKTVKDCCELQVA